MNEVVLGQNIKPSPILYFTFSRAALTGLSETRKDWGPVAGSSIGGTGGTVGKYMGQVGSGSSC